MSALDEEMSSLPPSPGSAGAILMAARQDRGLEAIDMSNSLHLSLRQVEALESDQFDRLSGATFIRGIIRSYAKALQIDPQPALDAYARVAPKAPDPAIGVPSHGIRFQPEHAKAWNSSIKLGLASLTFIVVVAGGWLWYSGAGGTVNKKPAAAPAAKSGGEKPAPPVTATTDQTPPAVPTAAPAPAVIEPAPAPVQPADTSAAGKTATQAAISPAPVVQAPVQAAPVSPSTAQAPAAAPPMPQAPSAQAASVVEQPTLASGRSVLHFTFKADAWLEVRDGSGRLIFSQLKPRGSEQVLTGRPPFALVVGNAANVQLTYNDKPVDLMPHVKVSIARMTLK